MDGWNANNGGGEASGMPGVHNLPEIKSRIHRKLLGRLNLANLESVSREDATRAIRTAIQEILVDDQAALNIKERELLQVEILDEIFGLGPLEPLMKDPEVSDILVNTFKDVWIEKGGKLFPTDIRFKDDTHLMQVIDRIVSGVGRRIDDSSPMVDARLPDNSRVNAIIPPLAVDGPHMSIRRFKRDVLSDEDLMSKGAFNKAMLEVLHAVVVGRLNILISGGTGAGKTTLLNVLSSHIPGDERIVTIEDSAELQLRQPHVVRLETRPPNVEGKGEVTARALVVNSLRMRPDRIIVGHGGHGEPESAREGRATADRQRYPGRAPGEPSSGRIPEAHVHLRSGGDGGGGHHHAGALHLRTPGTGRGRQRPGPLPAVRYPAEVRRHPEGKGCGTLRCALRGARRR
jgi:Flp pilus assembly CpaF family ATPase